MSRRMIIVVEESDTGGGFRASVASVPGVVAIAEEGHPDPGAREGRTPGEALERVATLVDRELARAGWTSITTEADVDDLVDGPRPVS